MQVPASGAPVHFVIVCHTCVRGARARRDWTGREVKCPHCGAVLSVPPPDQADRPVAARKPSLAAKRGFNFACPRCDVLLESHTGMSGRNAVCPTCAARFCVPFVDPDNGQPDAAALLDEAPALPTPLHAYAASGTEAPQIVRTAGGLEIECPRCKTYAPIDAESCPECRTPFTIESTESASSVRSEARASVALMLGIVGLPLCFLLLPSLIATGVGLSSLWSGHKRQLSWRAVTGAILGAIGTALGGLVYLL